MDELKVFYDRQFKQKEYGRPVKPEDHSHYSVLKQFIESYQLQRKRCLEVGCGRGAFQDIVEDYTGVDISNSVRTFLHKPFFQSNATKLPFEDNSFEAAWTIAVLEHVPDPEKALLEIRRVLKPEGLFHLAAAWQCRSWAADGYPMRPYSDFNLKGKIIKASIPLRNSVLFRSMHVFPGRLAQYLKRSVSKSPLRFRCRKLRPNYDHFWMADSDAINSMDPFEAILWFVSRGDQCLSYPNWLSRFLVRTGAINFRIRKNVPAVP